MAEAQVISAQMPGAVTPAPALVPNEARIPASVWSVLAGGSSIVVGILWDISWHRTIGRDTFWTPAHMAIYAGGLLGGLTCGWLVIRATFFATAQEQACCVRL